MNTIKIALVFAMATLLLLSCSKGNNTVEANIQGLGNDSLYVTTIPVDGYYKADTHRLDTIVAKDNKFVINVVHDRPALVNVFPQQKAYIDAKGKLKKPAQYYMTLLIQPGDQIEIEGQLEDMQLIYKAKGGSDFNEDYSTSRESYLNRYVDLLMCDLQLDSVRRNKGEFDVLNTLTQQRRELLKKPTEPIMDYIKVNPDKELSAFYLFRQRTDVLIKYYDHLTEEVREGAFKSLLEHKKNAYEEKMEAENAVIDLVEGKIAPDFTLKTISGDSLNLKTLQHKYVVLDFWGSWCGWCIMGFPKMKKYYEKYNGDIEIVGIACKDKESKWRKVVAEHELKWLNVINDKTEGRDLTKLYQVYSYPTKIIIDRDRNIVGRFSGEKPEFYSRMDELMSLK